jgi:hypothetical protein
MVQVARGRLVHGGYKSTVTCYHLPHPRMPHEYYSSAPFVSIIAPWGEVTDNRSLSMDLCNPQHWGRPLAPHATFIVQG